MRASWFRFTFCLTFATAFASTADAGVRGKPTNVKAPTPAAVAQTAVAQTAVAQTAVAQRRVAQATNEYSPVKPVPQPSDLVQTETVINESVVNESVVNETVIDQAHSNCACAPAIARSNTNTVFVPMPMMMPMMMPQQPVMHMMSTPACSTCGGGMGGGLSPAAAASYGQAFPGGYYRGGAEAGMHHFPYYSYRRPWYFPGQPSFHRSTDLIW